MSDNSIISGLTYIPPEGSLKFKGVPYLMIRPETIASLQTEIEQKMGHVNASEAFYNAGFTGGKLSGARYREEYKLTAQEAVEFMCKMGSEIGWGGFRLVELDSASKRMVVEVRHSPFAEAYGKSEHQGVCHLIRGVLGGLAHGIFHQQVKAIESMCSALGDPLCRFEIESSS